MATAKDENSTLKKKKPCRVCVDFKTWTKTQDGKHTVSTIYYVCDVVLIILIFTRSPPLRVKRKIAYLMSKPNLSVQLIVKKWDELHGHTCTQWPHIILTVLLPKNRKT